MRIVIEVEVPTFKTQRDRSKFDRATWDAVRRMVPNFLYCVIQDATFDRAISPGSCNE